MIAHRARCSCSALTHDTGVCAFVLYSIVNEFVHGFLWHIISMRRRFLPLCIRNDQWVFMASTIFVRQCHVTRSSLHRFSSVVFVSSCAEGALLSLAAASGLYCFSQSNGPLAGIINCRTPQCDSACTRIQPTKSRHRLHSTVP